MDDSDMQQFSLHWHNHQSSVVSALARMLASGTLTDVTLSAGGTSLKAHRLVLASCSQYFAQLFKEVEGESNSLVVVLSCEATELRLLLTFMYTGEVTASKKNLPSLLKLAQTLKVSGLTDCDTNAAFSPTNSETKDENHKSESPINLELNKNDIQSDNSNFIPSETTSPKTFDDTPTDIKETSFNFNTGISDIITRNERLSKLDQIVQNLYSTHKIGTATPITPPVLSNLAESQSRKSALGVVCYVCNKRLSNQYNLRVHLETHAGRRHACRACAHVSRSRDALRKHVAYRHAGGKNERMNE